MTVGFLVCSEDDLKQGTTVRAFPGGRGLFRLPKRSLIHCLTLQAAQYHMRFYAAYHQNVCVIDAGNGHVVSKVEQREKPIKDPLAPPLPSIDVDKLVGP